MLQDLMGREITAMVTDENDQAIFAQKDGHTFRLAKSELKKVPKPGAMITGFAYEDENHHLALTKTLPKSRLDWYDWGTVVKVNRSLGVFVDIGLPNKDVAVSLDDLPTITELWPNVGDKLLLALKVDAKGRLWGELATEEQIRQVSVRADRKMKNRNVTGTVYRLKMVGTFILTDHYNLGFIHPSEREQEPRLGQVVSGRVIDVKPDGSLNISLRPRAFEAIGDDAQMILAALQHTPGYVLPFTDKSSPDEIKAYFGISKGQFKRAVGHLMKAGVVKQADGLLELIQQD
ncbi:S1-like domain-containing RNA-binding protein [Ligilactobacillus equi]|uniref:S1 motif domain-containing protein n=2 Tax=Ligilactobacillus equi TaxID=137357 RepID=V7HVD2_9LACO|nr:S1-like domain-containing RNA-binding protein [Ligilactobacillus equi]ETA73183.1 hypothetical protein LEQ_2188 [Ligilactobacillus equi DPC 6820]KRL81359.1 hypothetical protein FC36_GL001762 [Ligilactobacillus equi DSM 15833 = JCM 10991]MCQ2557016.1 S1-like domain-containing RNA-binding protein [Ligilactobacillus sp.]